MLTKYIEIKNVFAREGVILYYDGAISHDLVVEIADIVKRKMKVDAVKSSTTLKVFSAVIEQLQNIFFYSDDIICPANTADGEKEMRRGMLIVGQEGNQYFVIGGNLIANDKVPVLRDKLLALQQMSKEELKRFSLEQRRQGPDRESRGAGLGFIELARQASSSISFEFTPASQGVSYFFVKTLIE